MTMVFGWILAAAGAIPLVLARRALRSGEVKYGDQVSQQRYRRDESPGNFWAGVVFYVLLGIGMIVAGVLAGLGVIA
jgi:hypothetical protein